MLQVLPRTQHRKRQEVVLECLQPEVRIVKMSSTLLFYDFFGVTEIVASFCQKSSDIFVSGATVGEVMELRARTRYPNSHVYLDSNFKEAYIFSALKISSETFCPVHS